MILLFFKEEITLEYDDCLYTQVMAKLKMNLRGEWSKQDKKETPVPVCIQFTGIVRDWYCQLGETYPFRRLVYDKKSAL